MKFVGYSALVASASAAAIHDACTDTWDGAADAVCSTIEGGSICFDWQSEDQSSSTGLFCGKQADCDAGKFQWQDPAKPDDPPMKFFARCKGLSGSDCSTDRTVCDDKASFVCADWIDATGKVVVGCAAPTECGHKANAHDVVCSGLAGDTCKTDAECDDKAKYRCAEEFNNQTYAFSTGTNKCVDEKMCNSLKNGTEHTLMLCYNDVATKCNNETACAKPENDTKDVSCAYLAPGGKNMSSGICVDKDFCVEGSYTEKGVNATYFGNNETMLWCGSARTALAMGAAAISAYLAM